MRLSQHHEGSLFWGMCTACSVEERVVTYECMRASMGWYFSFALRAAFVIVPLFMICANFAVAVKINIGALLGAVQVANSRACKAACVCDTFVP